MSNLLLHDHAPVHTRDSVRTMHSRLRWVARVKIANHLHKRAIVIADCNHRPADLLMRVSDERVGSKCFESEHSLFQRCEWFHAFWHWCAIGANNSKAVRTVVDTVRAAQQLDNIVGPHETLWLLEEQVERTPLCGWVGIW